MQRAFQLMLFISCLILTAAAIAVAGGWVSVDQAATGVLAAEAVTAVDLKKLEDAMQMAFDRMGGNYTELKTQMLELAQKHGYAPFYSGAQDNELSRIIAASEGLKNFSNGNTASCQIQVPHRLLAKTAIINATGQSQPLVPTDRGPVRIVTAPQQRLTIRGLFSSLPTQSNLVEVPTEATATLNARSQGDASPGGIEGEEFAESAMTFTLATHAVVTIGHWIPASRQILSDALALQRHIEDRLLYGLAIEEEQQFLTGTGAAGEINGINNRATAYNRGATNDSAIDTMAKAADQLALSNYEPTGFILHPTDWLNMKLLKDTQGRYLLGDPAAASMPQLWGLPVVPTVSQTQGKFTVLDAQRYGYIADREDANVRISESHDKFFIRGMVAILAEERTVLVAERGGAAVYGNVSHAG